ncbi:hypothetical protein F8S13_18295 [Chloroflexia bacterium SDU3-3]|nr:hypothetical protein F8S13_18295 [Chloroflexia bacterium SDU3-3]
MGSSISQADQIATAQQSFLVIQREPAIKDLLESVGYTDGRLESDKASCDAAAQAIEQQDAARMDQIKASEKVTQLRAEAEAKYSALATTVRAVFPADKALHEKLGLRGTPSQQRTQSGFLRKARALYDGVLHQPDLLPPLAEAGYGGERLAGERAALDVLQQADADQEAAKFRAQTATAEQKQALAELRSRRSRFAKLAKLALKGNPQALAALGLR